MSSGGQYAGMSPKIILNRGSVCRNDSTTNRTDKTRKILLLNTKIQYLIKILGVINAFQKQRGVSMAGMGVTLLRNGGSLSAGIYEQRR